MKKPHKEHTRRKTKRPINPLSEKINIPMVRTQRKAKEQDTNSRVKKKDDVTAKDRLIENTIPDDTHA